MTGQILDVAAGDYYADALDDRPSLNASIAKILINDSPRHAWWAHARLNPRYASVTDRKFDVGTVVHRMLLEPERENRVEIIDASDYKTKAAREARDAAREAGNTPLLVDEWSRVTEMLAAVREQLPLLDVDPLPFVDGKGEQTVVWEDDRTGVLCRARLDWLHDDLRVIDDGKTSKYTANPLQWTRRTLWSIGADVQHVFYRRGVAAVTGELPDLRFVVMETQPPFAVSIVSLAESAITLAEAKVNAALGIWKRCLERDEWPGYVPRVVEAGAPAWAEMDFWDRQQLEEDALA